jgi:NADH dehydrogenase (ubiquinone) Fe-S protein 3
MNKNLPLKYVETLKKLLPVKNIKIFNNETVIIVSPEKIRPVLLFLKNHINSQYKILTAISGVDYPEKKNRFEVAYEILSIKYNTRIRVKTYLNEITPINSVVNIYSCAN